MLAKILVFRFVCFDTMSKYFLQKLYMKLNFVQTMKQYLVFCMYCFKLQKSIKKYQQSLREVQARLEEESRSKEIAHDALINNERRAHANKVCVLL
jgi:chromosome condensin MukBEF ATPase and DNA-binding subunit MukB